MLTLLSIIFLILMVGTIILAYICWNKDWNVGIFIASVVVAVISAIALFVSVCCLVDACFTVKTEFVIDEKIAMYQEENEKIEKSIQELVDSYKEYEQETFKEFKVEDVAVAVSMIPELKSDTLVQQQIGVLNENRKIITGLKEEKINVKKAKYYINFSK